jgi:hypothetical protein
MPGSDALKGDIAAIMQRNQQQQQQKEEEEEEQKKENSAPPVDDKKSKKNESGWKKKKAEDEPPEDEGPGTYQKAHGARPKTGEENIHNKTIAEAAAKKFKKDQKKIQRAVRKIDPDTPKQGCACVIM